jgi:hypothetical protein
VRSPAQVDEAWQIRDGRPIFQARMLAVGAIPLDATASVECLADTVLALAHP